jgi:hypothetical protein
LKHFTCGECAIVTEVVELAYVGRTHRPCGACGVLVWIPEGCPHMRAGKDPQAPSSHTRNNRRYAAAAAVRAREDVAALLRTL